MLPLYTRLSITFILAKSTFYRSSSGISLIILAGFPATIVQGGTSFVTTDPAPTIEPSPIVTPFKIIELKPIQTLLHIFTGHIFT